MSRFRICWPTTPSRIFLILGCILTVALVLLLAGWGVLWWVVSGLFLIVLFGSVAQRLVQGKNADACAIRQDRTGNPDDEDGPAG